MPSQDEYVQIGQLFQFLGEDKENSCYSVRPHGDFNLDTLRITPETEVIGDRPIEIGDLIYVSLNEDWTEAKAVRLIKTLDGQMNDIDADGLASFTEYFMNNIKLIVPKSIATNEMIGKHYLVESFEIESFLCDRTIIRVEKMREIEFIIGEIVQMENDHLSIVSAGETYTIQVNSETKFETTFPLEQNGGVRYYTDDEGNMIAISVLIYVG